MLPETKSCGEPPSLYGSAGASGDLHEGLGKRVVVAGCVGLAVGAGQARACIGLRQRALRRRARQPGRTNTTALYYNPAGIAFSEGDRHLRRRRACDPPRDLEPPHRPGQPGTPPLPKGAVGNTGKAHLFNVFGGPAVGATSKFGNLAVGAGLFVPFGGRVYWDKNDPAANEPEACPLAADGVQRWHIINAALTFIYASPRRRPTSWAPSASASRATSSTRRPDHAGPHAGRRHRLHGREPGHLDVNGLQRELRGGRDARGLARTGCGSPPRTRRSPASARRAQGDSRSTHPGSTHGELRRRFPRVAARHHPGRVRVLGPAKSSSSASSAT